MSPVQYLEWAERAQAWRRRGIPFFMKHNPTICLSLPLVLCLPLGMDYTSDSGLAAYSLPPTKPTYGRGENERASFRARLLQEGRLPTI